MPTESRHGGRAIRDARPADAEPIRDLLLELGYPLAGEMVSAKIERLAADPRSRLLVMEIGGAVAGFISVYFIPQLGLAGDLARISYLAVAPRFRSQGLGAALLKQAEDLARQRGCDRLEVHCHQRRVRAHGFYEGHGFSESPKYFVKSLLAGP